MINAIHSLIYSDDAPATRAFFRDVLGWPFVEFPDTGSGWLIFGTGPSELGVHPTAGEWEGKPYSSPLHHSVSFMCYDIHATVDELRAKGAEFKGEVQDQGFGYTIMMAVPGAGDIMVYQPLHQKAYELG